jgi:hypothetical protein
VQFMQGLILVGQHYKTLSGSADIAQGFIPNVAPALSISVALDADASV